MQNIFLPIFCCCCLRCPFRVCHCDTHLFCGLHSVFGMHDSTITTSLYYSWLLFVVHSAALVRLHRECIAVDLEWKRGRALPWHSCHSVGDGNARCVMPSLLYHCYYYYYILWLLLLIHDRAELSPNVSMYMHIHCVPTLIIYYIIIIIIVIFYHHYHCCYHRQLTSNSMWRWWKYAHIKLISLFSHMIKMNERREVKIKKNNKNTKNRAHTHKHTHTHKHQI